MLCIDPCQFRSRWRHAPNQQCRKARSLQIRSLHRKEVRSWKTQNLAEHLEDVSKWKCLKTWLPNPVGRAIAQHPLEGEFADKDHLLKLDVSFRKLCRSIVAPPSDTDWSLEWHDIFHQWNIRVQDLASAAAIKPWWRIVCKQHGDLFCYVAQLPEHRWVRRMLAWNPAIRARQLGRPRHTWDQKVTAFCRYKQFGHWMEYAQDKKTW